VSHTKKKRKFWADSNTATPKAFEAVQAGLWPVTSTTTNMSTDKMEIEQEMFIDRMEEASPNVQSKKRTKTRHSQNEEIFQESGESSETPNSSKITSADTAITSSTTNDNQNIQEIEITGPKQAEPELVITGSHELITIPEIDKKNQATEEQIDRHETLEKAGGEIISPEGGYGLQRPASRQDTQDEILDRMETESANTVRLENDKGKQRSYNEVLRGNTIEEAPKRRVFKVSEREARWTSEIIEAIAKKVEADFDDKEWHIERIVRAFESLKELEALLRHKIQMKPSRNSLPEAIRLKFKHRDTAFFKTFARGNEVRPQH